MSTAGRRSTRRGRHADHPATPGAIERNERDARRRTPRCARGHRDRPVLPGRDPDRCRSGILCGDRSLRVRAGAQRGRAGPGRGHLRHADAHRRPRAAAARLAATGDRRGQRSRRRRWTGSGPGQRRPHRRRVRPIQRGLCPAGHFGLRHRRQLAAPPAHRRLAGLGADADRADHRCGRSGPHRPRPARRARRPIDGGRAGVRPHSSRPTAPGASG